ncbi:VOC family protein [Deinococcus sp. RM]|uniref:VOC family protein n=1 Tax=Deinococcus sp. RM TaxID=2316359 RepID=UPI000FF66246|nr:VOC family protein [Deinococcus sp. RM]RIY04584.1 glyoxalase/bleomycin resistance/extradiol dioxygenase family protein [Deinococcus sp. RM]
MSLTALSITVLSADPVGSALYYRQHFGFLPTAELDWFVSLQHPDLPGLHLDLLRQGHPAAGPLLSRQQTSGIMLALIVPEVEAEARRLERAGLSFVLPVTTEPWGQKRVQFQAPDGVTVELLEFVAPDPEWLARQTAPHT